ncbi:MAG: 2-oxoglutaramate amidase [Syntrophomonadaceae bacterium]|nr:2-oxoglutaramate amidase [Bacillota bacterium]
MQATTLSFAESSFCSPAEYQVWLEARLPAGSPEMGALLVLPAYLALLAAWRFGDLGNPVSFEEAISLSAGLPDRWHENWLELHRVLARRLKAWLVPGTAFVVEQGRLFHTCSLFSPDGDLLGSQRQLFLTREERKLGLSRGCELRVWETPFGRLGIIVGTDAWYPEAGRILALQGAEIICCPGALPKGESRWRQISGIWAQVQQNQFFAVESQLVADIAGQEFAAESLVHAPCEMTEGCTGIVARGGLYGSALSATLDREARRKVITSYPLLRLLRPGAYSVITESGGAASEIP